MQEGHSPAMVEVGFISTQNKLWVSYIWSRDEWFNVIVLTKVVPFIFCWQERWFLSLSSCFGLPCTGGPRDTRLMGTNNGRKIPRISNFHVSRIMLVKGGFSHLINYLRWFWLNSTVFILSKWFFNIRSKGKIFGIWQLMCQLGIICSENYQI